MKVLIQDIAKAAHVSPATVSNVLNNTNRVSEETRIRILELAHAMGYHRPEYINPKHNIHLVIFHKADQFAIDTRFLSEMISGVEHICHKTKYSLSISHISRDSEKDIKHIIENPSQSILLLATEMQQKDVRPFLKFEGPLVLLDNYFLEYSFHCTTIDNLKAGYLAGCYLIKNGHKDFGLIASSQSLNNMRDRRAGFEIALREHHFTLKEENVFYVAPTFDIAKQDMEAYLAQRKDKLPTAMFAFNDVAGAAVLHILKNHGMDIPNDVSLIGMDNTPFSTMDDPPITTLHVPKYELGAAAAEQLIALSQSEPVKKLIPIEPKLVIRKSVLPMAN